MNNIAKFAIAAGVTALGIGVTVHYAKKVKEKKYAEVPVKRDIAAEAVEQDHKDDTILERIKMAAMKKAIRIAGWVVLHQQEVQAVSMMLGIVGGIFSVVNGIKEFALGKKLHAQLEKIDGIIIWQNEMARAYNCKVEKDIDRFSAIMNAIEQLPKAPVESTV